MDKVFIERKKTLKIYWKKILQTSGKSRGILSVYKSGNHVYLLYSLMKYIHTRMKYKVRCVLFSVADLI